MYLTLRDRWNRATRADVIVTDGEVVLKIDQELMGRFPRQQVSNWLEHPDGEIENGQTVLMAVPNGVALGIGDEVPMWPLHDAALSRLRDALTRAE